MRALSLAVSVTASLLAPGPAAAQPDADPLLLGSPRPADEEAPAPPARDGRDPRDPTGWAVFGGHLGFFTSVAASMSLIYLTRDDVGAQRTVGMAILPTTVGLTTGGGFLFSKLARRGSWDATAGWGAAGVFPGAMAGLALGGGTLLSADAHPSGGVRALAALVGGVAGAYLGYRAFVGMAERRGSASWEVLAAWIGFFAGEIVGIAAAAGTIGGTRDNAHVPLLFAGAGGAAGAFVGHQLATW